jgi:hypothetical protein
VQLLVPLLKEGLIKALQQCYNHVITV